MKRIIFIFFISCFFLVWFLGFLIGGIGSIMVLVISIIVNSRIEKILLLNEYANEYENIYVVSNHPRYETQIKLPNEIEDFVVRCSYEDVIKTIHIQKELLREANNRLFCDPNLKEDQRLKVIPIIFQDGEFVNESWKQFKKRVIFEIKEDRSIRHAMLKATDPIWYNKHGNNQSGIIWSK